MEEILSRVVPIAAIFIFVCAFVHTRITNPENKHLRTRTSVEALRRKEICPRCGVRMKKTWVKRSMGLSRTDPNRVYEELAAPEFTCPKCRYKIEAQFGRSSR